MPRFLWLGLIVCAALVLSALALLRSAAPQAAVAPSAREETAGAAELPRELVGSAVVERSSVPASRTPEHGPRDEPPGPEIDFVTGEPVEWGPKFDDGVVEVRVVRDEDGTPIAGARVAYVGHDVPGLVTDPAGVAVFTGVLQGRSTFTASADARAPSTAEAQVSRESSYATVELRLTVQRDVVVRLLDPHGRAFRPEDWGLGREEAERVGILLAAACARSGGSIDIGGAPAHRARSADRELGPFTWRLEIRGVGEACLHAVLGDAVLAVEPLDPRATEIELRADAAALASALTHVVVRVLAAADGAPIRDAFVEFGRGQTTRSSARTDGAGRVAAGLVLAGTLEVLVRSRGYAPQAVALVHPIPSEVVVRMEPGRRIAGRVVDQDGSPLAGARVEVRGTGAGLPVSLHSAKGGVFEFEDLPSLALQVLATYSAKSSAGGGQRVTAAADCREGDVLGLEIRIPVPKGGAVTTPR